MSGCKIPLFLFVSQFQEPTFFSSTYVIVLKQDTMQKQRQSKLLLKQTIYVVYHILSSPLPLFVLLSSSSSLSSPLSPPLLPSPLLSLLRTTKPKGNPSICPSCICHSADPPPCEVQQGLEEQHHHIPLPHGPSAALGGGGGEGR